MYLFRLIYYSRNTLAEVEQPRQRAELKAILASAQKNNPPLGVTGALLYNQSYFAQVLEGDRKAVTEVFCRIARDERHSDLVILEGRPITKRRFADWSMCFAGQPVAEEVYRRYCVSNQFNPAKMGADSLLGFMEELVDLAPHAVHADRPQPPAAPRVGAEKLVLA
ncbi:MAG: BLUF domain-containing protein [Pseudomonadota bacterium]|nr:BLUF domain-containing protein [Pseudomonadota bacterium]